MELHYCRRCGQKLTNTERHIYKCNDGHTIYATTNPTTGVFIFNTDGNVLLAVRGIEPHKGMLDTIGGFVDEEETTEEAAIREIQEETGLSPEDYTELTYLTSGTGHYPHQGEVLPVLTSFFYTSLKPGAAPLATDDVASLVACKLSDVDFTLLHDDDIRAGVRALQKKFDY